MRTSIYRASCVFRASSIRSLMLSSILATPFYLGNHLWSGDLLTCQKNAVAVNGGKVLNIVGQCRDRPVFRKTSLLVEVENLLSRQPGPWTPGIPPAGGSIDNGENFYYYNIPCEIKPLRPINIYTLATLSRLIGSSVP